MSKPKYPFEKRLEVVNHYFTTDDGYRIISARFGVPRTQVRTWVALSCQKTDALRILKGKFDFLKRGLCI